MTTTSAQVARRVFDPVINGGIRSSPPDLNVICHVERLMRPVARALNATRIGNDIRAARVQIWK